MPGTVLDLEWNSVRGAAEHCSIRIIPELGQQEQQLAPAAAMACYENTTTGPYLNTFQQPSPKFLAAFIMLSC
jgi:hypothetical protein